MTDAPAPLGLARGAVLLREPDERWAKLFQDEATRLAGALGTFDASIEHCGSTAVPGLPAKPILDLVVGVPEPVDVAGIAEALTPLGYEHASWAGVPGHEVFGRGAPRTHLVHVVPAGGVAWARMVGFRDALRKNPRLAAEYAALKRDLAARHPNRRSDYTEAKGAFIASVLAATLDGAAG